MKLSKRKNNGIWMVTVDGRRVSTGERDKARAKRAARIILDSGGMRPALGNPCRSDHCEILRNARNRSGISP